MSYPKPTKCPYCGAKVVFTSNKAIYGKEYGNGKCYKCTVCDTYVGCHPSGEPLGRLANKELRELKKKAHSIFDPMWRNGKMRRGDAYMWLAKKMNMPTTECHFGWFDKEMLSKAIEILENRGEK